MILARPMEGVPWGDVVYYDETSPTFLRWKVDVVKSNGVVSVARKGRVAGCVESNVCYCGNVAPVHRVIAHILIQPILPEDVIDHIDGNRANNNILNLRVVTSAVNSRNKRKRSNNTTGFTGLLYRENRCKWYYIAQWMPVGGAAQREKWFSVELYGEQGAKEMAIDYRCRMIEDMNSAGAMYSESHGVR